MGTSKNSNFWLFYACKTLNLLRHEFSKSNFQRLPYVFSRAMNQLIHHCLNLVIDHALKTATFCKVLPAFCDRHDLQDSYFHIPIKPNWIQFSGNYQNIDAIQKLDSIRRQFRINFDRQVLAAMLSLTQRPLCVDTNYVHLQFYLASRPLSDALQDRLQLHIITMLEETSSMRHRLDDSGKLQFQVLEASLELFPSLPSRPRHIDVW